MPNCPTCSDTLVVVLRDGYDADDHHFVETNRELTFCPTCSSLLRTAHALYDKYELEDELPFAEWITAVLQQNSGCGLITALDCDGLHRVEVALLNILQNGKRYTAAESMEHLFGTVSDAYAKGLLTRHLFAQCSWWVAAEQQATQIANHNRLADLHRIQGVDTYEH